MVLRLRTAPEPLLVLVAASLIGFADYYAYGAYTPRSLALVQLGCIAVAAALLLPALTLRHDSVVPQVAVVTMIVWQGLTLVRPTAIYGQGHALSDARYLSIALPVVAVAATVTTGSVSDWWWRLLLLGFAGGAVATIRASPRPAIDVWYLVQHAAHCVTHGCNPYTMTTPAAPGLRDGYPYLPASAVLLAPFKLLLGDIRYGEALGIVVAAAALRRCGTGRTVRLAPLVLCVPGLFFEVEQAWIESLLVALLFLAVRSRHSVGAALLLGLALASKQHVWLLLPVAALTLGLRTTALATVTGAAVLLPWFAVDPSAFWHNTVTQFVDLTPRVDSLSMWLHGGRGAALTISVLVAAYALVWLACRSVPHRFLLGSGVVLAAFDLMNKSSFYDQWVLVTWLLVAGAALELEDRTRRWPGVSIVLREV